MRGSDERTGSLFSFVDLEARVPILAAERRFVTPLLDEHRRTGRLPRRLHFARPASDVEEAVQTIAAELAASLTGHVALISYAAGPPTDFELRRRQRIACLDVRVAWRLAAT